MSLGELGGYQLVKRLGEGGMATAILGRSPGGRLVVLKVPLEASQEMAVKLRDEAQAGFRIRHPHVVETLDFFVDNGRPVLVVEYIDGCLLRDLRQLGGKPNPLPPAAVAYLGRALAEALHAIHEAKDETGASLRMLHRDVTPSNILIGRDGVPKLIDLGIARSRENQQEATQAGMLKGTLRYVAPELLHGETYSSATDLWSLGVCLFEAALGRQMVAGEAVAIFRAITAGSYRDLRRGESLNKDLERAIFALLTEKDMRLRNARAAASVFSRLEAKLVDEDENRYSGQAWLASWAPYATENEHDVDFSIDVVIEPEPQHAPAPENDEPESSVFADSTDLQVVKRGPQSTAPSTVASPPPTPPAPPEPEKKTVIGSTEHGALPTQQLPAVNIAPKAKPVVVAQAIAPTIALPKVDIMPTTPVRVKSVPASGAPTTAAIPAAQASGDVLPEGAATLVMPSWEPPVSADDDSDLSLPRPIAPSSAEAKPTMLVPRVADLPIQSDSKSDSTSDSDDPAATLIMGKVDIEP